MILILAAALVCKILNNQKKLKIIRWNQTYMSIGCSHRHPQMYTVAQKKKKRNSLLCSRERMKECHFVGR